MDNNRTIGRFMSNKSLIVIALLITLLSSSVFTIIYYFAFKGYTSIEMVVEDTHVVPVIIVYIDWIAQTIAIILHILCHHSNMNGGNSRYLKLQIWSIVAVDIFYAFFDVLVEYFMLKEFSSHEVLSMFLIVVSVFSNILIWIPFLKAIDDKEPIDYKMIFIGVIISLVCYAYSTVEWIIDMIHRNAYYTNAIFREFALILFLIAIIITYKETKAAGGKKEEL